MNDMSTLTLKYQPLIDCAKKYMSDFEEGSPLLAINEFKEQILNDNAAMSLLKHGNTFGLPVLSSSGMRDFLRRLSPINFDELTASVALYRPSPLAGGLCDAYLQRKYGHQEVTYLLPSLASTLKETYGLILYHDQYLHVMNEIGGYSVEQSEVFLETFNRADKRTKHGQKFFNSISDKNVSNNQITMFLQMLYPYDKSIAEEIALIALQGAYFMAHIPNEFIEMSIKFGFTKFEV